MSEAKCPPSHPSMNAGTSAPPCLAKATILAAFFRYTGEWWSSCKAWASATVQSFFRSGECVHDARARVLPA